MFWFRKFRRHASEPGVATSFTFQAPGFHERYGYGEIFRWEPVPTPD
jgi:hypothetical protein